MHQKKQIEAKFIKIVPKWSQTEYKFTQNWLKKRAKNLIKTEKRNFSVRKY